MTTTKIHQTIAHIRELQQHMLDAQRFRGYSGVARALSGTVALIVALVLGSPDFPARPASHLIGWGVAVFICALMNYGAVLHWFLYDEQVNRDPRRLSPTLEVMPAIFVGGILTFVLARAGAYDFLFGTWMCLFGIANLASRQVLPKWVWPLGWYYIVCGTACLLIPTPFMSPWSMGIVFFAGELAGGIILRSDRKRLRHVSPLVKHGLPRQSLPACDDEN
ncbi:MAG: hypothetical protein ACAI35_09715 [Candidatus Methylacidiphilales bacterium]|nr:hypothetical protein [Candidatus Methylacidiphilales bacterium]